ncbi:alpha/beta hydrolase-fold protein [Aquimarina intermedia]|uniref:Putative esterase n=1 Tax=Aquimarina intermedia TaxID=350814 RepID=A0A5S5C0S8_9FLAO|nr:alpha/beta hydrolase-fold protein [Aquimarina intermedia]TYP71563.1 putative esterase [Aquimarina intermedia]
MKKTTFIIIISLWTTLHLVAQHEGAHNILGTNHFIDSGILGEKRQVQIYLPTDYTETDNKYPVLYLLDGQQFFSHGVSLSKTFNQFNLTPEFIIVGINTSYPQRYSHFGNDMDKFIEFMDAELLPFIEENFRANSEKLLFGWQYAGSLGFNIMLKNTIAFNGYFLASPFPIQDKIEALNSTSIKNTALYFSVSPDEYDVNHGTDKLDSLLSDKKIRGLDWSYLKLINEEHHSTGYTTLYHGLRKYFKYYQEFQEDNLEKFITAGGLDYAYTYARARGLNYGFSSDLSTWSKFTIIRSAIRAKDYDHFETFTNEFVNIEFISDLKNRASDIAVFYEVNKKYNKAIEIYKMLLVEFPESEKLLKRIGNAYLALDNKNEAKKYFQLATENLKSKI